ncbi:unannotated protein [freshwater metagenome]|uniref:Unannotated protein n=1 Tax=freshwater metagenome TaxID=449393 RepID=A0A6J7C7W7_9ZZZZ
MAERLVLDEEVARDLERAQTGVGTGPLDLATQQRLHGFGGSAGPECGIDEHHVGHHNGDEVRTGAVSVHVDLQDQIAAVLECGADRAAGDELALCQLHHVVAAVDEHEVVGAVLLHDVAGADEAVVGEELRRRRRVLEVPRNGILGLRYQLATRVGLVGAEVAQLGHVEQSVVDDRRALHSVANGDRGVRLGVAIGLDERNVGVERTGELLDLLGERRRAGDDGDNAVAHEPGAHLGHHLGLDLVDVAARRAAVRDRGEEVTVDHVEDAREQGELGGSGELHIFEERGHVGTRGEVARAATRQSGVHLAAAHLVVERCEAQPYHWDGDAAHHAELHTGEAVGEHCSLRRPCAAGGVHQHRKALGCVRLDRQGCEGVRVALGDEVVKQGQFGCRAISP